MYSEVDQEDSGRSQLQPLQVAASSFCPALSLSLYCGAHVSIAGCGVLVERFSLEICRSTVAGFLLESVVLVACFPKNSCWSGPG